VRGVVDFSVACVLLAFLGAFGVHRFYMGKFFTGLLWALTGGFFLVGWVYDYWTLNDQIAEINQN